MLVADQVARCAFGHHFAVIEDGQPLAEPFGFIHEMRGQQDGLALRQQLLQAIPDQVPGLRMAVVFGSRAKGTHRPGSDVDLALFGESIRAADLVRLSEHLNEDSPLPYRFDVVQYETLASEELRSHIDRVGLRIWPAPPLS